MFSTKTPERERAVVIDSSPELGRIMASFLERAGFDTYAISDVSEAWETIAAGSIDILVTDGEMPSAGLELLIRTKAKDPVRPAVILTARDAGRLVEDAYRHRAEAVFSKPLQFAALCDLARKVVLPRSVTFGRRPFRVSTKMPLVVGGGFRGTSTVLSNLHENGMFLVWEKDVLPSPGEKLDFVVPAHGCMVQDDVLGRCQVCWTREKPMESNPRGFGVQFVDLPADSASRLTRLVNAIKTGILRI